MDDAQVVRSLGALAQEHRLKVFRALVVAGPQGLTPGVLSERLSLSPAGMSFHLKELLNAGLISQTRDGRHLVYRADFAAMNGLVGYLTENCCGGNPDACKVPDKKC